MFYGASYGHIYTQPYLDLVSLLDELVQILLLANLSEVYLKSIAVPRWH